MRVQIKGTFREMLAREQHPEDQSDRQAWALWIQEQQVRFCVSCAERLICVKNCKSAHLKHYETEGEAEERGRGQIVKGFGCLVKGLMNNFEQNK